MAPRQVLRKFSGTVCKVCPVLRTMVRFWKLFQPVYWRSAITSHMLSICLKNETLAVSGTFSDRLMFSLKLPLVGGVGDTATGVTPVQMLVLTMLASVFATGTNGAGNVGTSGLVKFTDPPMLNLIGER